jgi:hypothetical protein
MVYKMLYGVVCYAYANGLRALVKKAIDDPDTDWDDIALGILDKIFNYNE